MIRLSVPLSLTVGVWCLPLATAFDTYDTDGEISAAGEEIRWAMNRARFDTAAENSLRRTNYTDVPATTGPLAPHSSLLLAAQRHAEDMSRTGLFQHATVPTSRYYNATTQPRSLDRMRAEGFAGLSGYGEVIVQGDPTPLEAYISWWTSSIHRQIFCEPRLREAGVGIDRDYYVVDFGARFDWPRFFTDTLFHDTNKNGRYDAGEGLAGLGVSVSQGTAGSSQEACDITATAGSFAVPLPQAFITQDPVSVRVHNLTLQPVELSLPRSFLELESIQIPAGKSVLVGTFAPGTQDNLGFRHLARQTVGSTPGLTLERVEALPVSREGDSLVIPFRFVLKNTSSQPFTWSSEQHGQSPWKPFEPRPGWALVSPSLFVVDPGSEWTIDVGWVAPPSVLATSPYLRRYVALGDSEFEFIFNVRDGVSVSPQWQAQHGLADADVFVDLDGDGFLSFTEERLGTDPRRADSWPSLEIVPGPAGTATVRWTGQPGITYRLQGSADAQNWEKIGLDTATPGAAPIMHQVPVDTGSFQFFRLASPR